MSFPCAHNCFLHLLFVLVIELCLLLLWSVNGPRPSRDKTMTMDVHPGAFLSWPRGPCITSTCPDRLSKFPSAMFQQSTSCEQAACQMCFWFKGKVIETRSPISSLLLFCCHDCGGCGGIGRDFRISCRVDIMWCFEWAVALGPLCFPRIVI